VCSGQSHMTFSVNQDMNGTAQIAASGQYPGIRMLTVDTDTSTTPLADIRRVKYGGGSWQQSDPAAFGTADFSYPSAICYYFAKQVRAHTHTHTRARTNLSLTLSLLSVCLPVWLFQLIKGGKGT
jgi:hypothetical protein